MVNSIERDKKRRRIAAQLHTKRIQYKYVIHDLSLPQQVRTKAICLLNKLPRNSSLTRLRNRCILSGRGRSVYQIWKLSRIAFREKALKGALPGIQKSTW